MPFIPAVNTAKVQVWQTLHGQKISNQFHVENSVPWGELSLEELAGNFITAWNLYIATVQSVNCQYDYVSARDMTTEEGFGLQIGFPALSGGDRTTPALPGNVAVACKLLTNFSGRNRQGRVFLGGLDEAAVVANELDTVYRNFIEDALRSVVQDINAGVGDVVIASYYDGMELELNARGENVWTPQPRPTALLTPVTNVTVERYTDSMRSRLQGRGN